MRNVSHVCWVLGQVALLTAGTVAQATTFSVKAVRKNPTCTAGRVGQVCFTDRQCDTVLNPPSFNGTCGGNITPTNTVNAVPGDKIVAEVFVSDWSMVRRARMWQVTFDTRSFFSGCSGAVVPVGWDRPRDLISCNDSSDCPPEWPVCFAECAACVGPNHHPGDGFLIDCNRPSYIFPGGCSLLGVDYCQYRIGDVLLNPSLGPVYTPPPKYLVTLALEVKPNSSGTFAISLLDFIGDVRATYVDDGLCVTDCWVLLEPLRINTGGCCEPRVGHTSPPNCAIDARQPSDPDGTDQAGWNSMELTFEPLGFPVPPVYSFSVAQSPLAEFETPPSIESMTVNGNKATLHFNRRISLKAWTCVSYDCASQRFCMGHLPADVNNDRFSSAVDIFKLIDNLNGQIQLPYPIYQCDIDRSNVCAPADILRVIDLLNGADAYDPWLGQTIPPCPSAQ